MGISPCSVCYEERPRSSAGDLSLRCFASAVEVTRENFKTSGFYVDRLKGRKLLLSVAGDIVDKARKR